MTLHVLCLLLIAGVRVSAFDTSHGCGVGHRSITAALDQLEVEQSAFSQRYHRSPSDLHDVEGYFVRAMSTETFIPLSTLDAMNLSRPIRMRVLWDVVDTGDPAVGGSQQGLSYQCSYVGEAILVRGTNGLFAMSPAGFCLAQHIVTGIVGSTRGALLRARTADAAAFYGAAIRVRPVLDDAILLSAPVLSAVFKLNVSAVSDADVVIVMTARPSPNAPLAGYAACLQREQLGRCTVAWVNWVPEAFSVGTSPASITSGLHTALHEFIHVLGGVGPGTSPSAAPFIDDSGVPLSPESVWLVGNDTAYGGKPMTFIITRRVRAVARAAFSCDSLPGFPLEDSALGRGAHWEARWAGPELMSYGFGSGAPLFSDLTIAFLEDTNQYIFNHSFAGPLLAAAPADYVPDLASRVDYSVSTVRHAPSPGNLSWGQGLGCSFVMSSARDWPAEYTCSQASQFGCTPDHAMAAGCVIVDKYSAESSCASWGGFAQGSGSDCSLANDACIAAPGAVSCGIPNIQQPFVSDADASAAAGSPGATARTTGGYSPALDYVPVWVGYARCRDADATIVVASSGFDALLGALGAPGGGQSHGAGTRCLVSNLQAASFIPAPQPFGHCYATNCARPDYLQVGVRSAFGGRAVYWYGCPAGGGRVFVVGFAGSIVCPPAAQWCASEAVTGVTFLEQNVVSQYLCWAVALCVVSVCLFCYKTPCWNDCYLRHTKLCCGVRAFQSRPRSSVDASTIPFFAFHNTEVRPAGPLTAQGPPLERYIQRLGKCPADALECALLTLNITGLFVSVAAIALYAAADAAGALLSAPPLFITLFIAFSCAMGIPASCKRAAIGPSCWLLLYAPLAAVATLALAWEAVYMTALDKGPPLPPRSITPGVKGLVMLWDSAYIQASIQDCPGCAGVIAAASASLLALSAALAAARIKPPRARASFILVCSAHCFAVCGGLAVATSIYLREYLVGATGSTLAAEASSMMLGSGAAAICVSAVGFFALRTESIPGAACYGAGIIILSCYELWVISVLAGPSAVAYLSAQSDADVAALASALGSNTQRADLIAPPFALLRGWALALGLSLTLNAVAIAGAAGTVAASFFHETIFPAPVPHPSAPSLPLATTFPAFVLVGVVPTAAALNHMSSPAAAALPALMLVGVSPTAQLNQSVSPASAALPALVLVGVASTPAALTTIIANATAAIPGLVLVGVAPTATALTSTNQAAAAAIVLVGVSPTAAAFIASLSAAISPTAGATVSVPARSLGQEEAAAPVGTHPSVPRFEVPPATEGGFRGSESPPSLLPRNRGEGNGAGSPPLVNAGAPPADGHGVLADHSTLGGHSASASATCDVRLGQPPSPLSYLRLHRNLPAPP